MYIYERNTGRGTVRYISGILEVELLGTVYEWYTGSRMVWYIGRIPETEMLGI